MAPLLAYLRELGVVPSPSPVQPSTRAEMLGERFRGYLAVERGLARGTVIGYVISHTNSQAATERRIDREVSALLAGIPQQGMALGQPATPVTLQF